MKFVLADIRNKKIYGLYGGKNEKYGDIYNYIMSADYQNCGYKFWLLRKMPDEVHK